MEEVLERGRGDHHQVDQGKLEDFLGVEPMKPMTLWLKEAMEKNVHEPNAISVSTIGEDGFPISRIVYLKDLMEEGLVFYTNYSSAKGKAIERNPNVHILIFWPELERQISIKGHVERVPSEMSDAYFESRPWGSKIGAWASHQSDALDSRKELEDRVHEYAEKFPDDVPRPDHWGGYLVRPVEVEFWQGRRSRLHDRIVYRKSESRWEIFRRNP